MENTVINSKKNKRSGSFLMITLVSIVSTYLLIVGGVLVSFHA